MKIKQIYSSNGNFLALDDTGDAWAIERIVGEIDKKPKLVWVKIERPFNKTKK